MAYEYNDTDVNRVDNTLDENNTADTTLDENNRTVRHGIDNNPNNDPEKGAALGGLGGAAVGAIAGSMIGPVGGIIGGIVGAVVGGGASGAAVAAVDAVDNDNTVSGIGSDNTEPTADTYNDTTARDREYENISARDQSYDTTRADAIDTGRPDTRNLSAAYDSSAYNTPTVDSTVERTDPLDSSASFNRSALGTDANLNPARVDGTYNSSDLNQNAARETVASDYDRTRDTVASDYDSTGDTVASDYDRAKASRPEIRTGGHDYDGTPDTRGLTEKAADKLTGDHIDDKTGKAV